MRRKLSQLAGAHLDRAIDSSRWSLPPLVMLELEHEYLGVLRTTVNNHFDAVRKAFAPNLQTGDEILHSMVSSYSQEYQHTRRLRHESAKAPVTPLREYTRFLRELYRPLPNLPRVMAAFTSLPSPHARYIQPTHLEDLVAVALNHRRSGAFAQVFYALEDAGLPVTARERAMYIQSLSNSGWHAQFEKWRQHFAATDDIGALNILLDVALRTRSTPLEEFVRGQMAAHGLREDRFTRLTVLKHCRNPTDIRHHLAAFRHDGYIIDIAVLSFLVGALIKSGQLSAAELVLSDAEHAHPHTYIVPGNPARVANILKALDGLSQTLGINIKIPVFPDSGTYVRFLDHALSRGDASSGIAWIRRMAEHGCFAPRSKLFSLLRLCTPVQKHELSNIVEAIDVVKPGYVSQSLRSSL